ncbi:MAG: tetratricopeptide repeat protein [Spirochaetaceae bacterium]|jgi:Flp pilus assembly protein TadD|nr:tetratricopeptide repeat protein [Spirochaetaceae bacterium]
METEPLGTKFAAGKLGYITIPLLLQKYLAGRTNFSLDFSIPLPVELPPEGEFTAEQISVEMFLSGILRDLSENPEGQHSAYYRELAEALRPNMPEELLEAAMFKARNGNYTMALEILSLLEGLRSRRPELLLSKAVVLEARALALENAAKYPEAEEAFTQTEQAYETALGLPVGDTFFKAGLFYRRRGDYRRAADCLAAYLNTEDPDISPPEDQMQDPESQREGRVMARELLAEIRNSGLDDEAFRGALELIRKGEEEKGIRRAREFLERRPGAGKGWFVLGWGLRRLSRWEDGRACFEKALELGCDNPDARNELAICLMEEGHVDRAEEELKKALQLDPHNVKIISNLGVLALKRGRDAEAEAFFRAALELNGEDPVVRAWTKSPPRP